MSFLLLVQAVLSLLLIAVILLQVKGTSLGLFGEAQGPRFQTKRGIERLLFQATIVLSVLFLLVSLTIVRFQSG